MSLDEVPAQEPPIPLRRQILSGVGKGLKVLAFTLFFAMNCMMFFWGPLYYPFSLLFVLFVKAELRWQLTVLFLFYAITGGVIGLCVNRKGTYGRVVTFVVGAILGPFWAWIAMLSKDGRSFRLTRNPGANPAERDALSLIHFLRDQGKPKTEWLAAITADQTISEPVRQRALQFAREWK